MGRGQGYITHCSCLCCPRNQETLEVPVAQEDVKKGNLVLVESPEAFSLPNGGVRGVQKWQGGWYHRFSTPNEASKGPRARGPLPIALDGLQQGNIWPVALISLVDNNACELQFCSVIVIQTAWQATLSSKQVWHVN